MLVFFFIYLIYYIYISRSTKKLRDLLLVTLGTITLLSINIYNTNNRLFKDPQLQKIVNKKYEFQFITKAKLEEGDSRLERIMDLDVRSKFGVRTLDGIENLPNLKSINILRQDKLIDYSKLSYLNNLENLYIPEPHPNFKINDLPELKKLKYLTVYLERNRFNNKIIELACFPNLEKLRLMSSNDQEIITIDIRQVPNIESLDIGMNVEKIIGLEEAKNLKSIMLDYGSDDYKDEVKRLRPDIELQ